MGLDGYDGVKAGCSVGRERTAGRVIPATT